MFIGIRRRSPGYPSRVEDPITFLQLHVSYYNIDPTMAASNPPQRERGFNSHDHKRKTEISSSTIFSVTSAHARFTSVSGKKTNDSHILTRQRSARPRASAQTALAASPAKAPERPHRDLPAPRSWGSARR